MQISPLTPGCLIHPPRRASATPVDTLAPAVETLPGKPAFPLPPSLQEAHRLADRHPSAAVAASGAPMVAAALALVQPETGRDYTVHTTWKGRPYEIPVRFGALLSRWCAKKGNRVDLDRLELVKTDGSRIPYLGTEVGQRYRHETGRDPHPWLQFDPNLQVYGLPSRPVTLDLRPDGTLTCTTEGIVNVDFRYHRERAYVERPPGAAELAAMPPEPWMGQPLQLTGDAFVYGRTPELRARAAEIFEDVCGKAARSGTLRGQPLHIFPVPDSKHWTAMPTVHQLQEQLLAMGGAAHGQANFLTTRQAVLIFVPESDLQGPGYGLRHELYHALEHKYLNEEQLAVVDSCHAELVRRGGPFQSVYGYQRHEFLTTMAEEFTGEHGPDGREWLRREQPRLADLFAELSPST